MFLQNTTGIKITQVYYRVYMRVSKVLKYEIILKFSSNWQNAIAPCSLKNHKAVLSWCRITVDVSVTDLHCHLLTVKRDIMAFPFY